MKSSHTSQFMSQFSLCTVDSQPKLLSRSPSPSLTPQKTTNVFNVTKTSATGPRRSGAFPEPQKNLSLKDLSTELSQSYDDDYLPGVMVEARSSSSRHQDLHHHSAEWWKQQFRSVALEREQRQAQWIGCHRRTAGQRANEDSAVVLPKENFMSECIAFFALQTEAANRECRLTRKIIGRQLVKAHWREQRRVAMDTIMQRIQQSRIDVNGPANSVDLQFLGGLRKILCITHCTKSEIEQKMSEQEL